MKRKRGTAKKKYDCLISAHNKPQINLKRLLHFLSCFWLVINCIVLANFLPNIKLNLVLLSFVVIFYAFIQQIDDRKGNWAWWGIVFWTIFSVAMPISCVLVNNLYWYLSVIVGEIIISTIIFIIFKKK